MDRSFFALFGCLIGATLIYSAIKQQRLLVVEEVPMTAKRSIFAFCIVTLMFAAGFTGSLYPSYRKAIDIQRNGVRKTADVVDISTRCGRGGCRYWVRYRYSTSDNAYRSNVKYTGVDQVEFRDLADIQTYRQVPIAFARDNPDRSAIDIGNSALTDQIPSFLSLFYFLMGISVAGGIVAIAFSGKSLRRPSA